MRVLLLILILFFPPLLRGQAFRASVLAGANLSQIDGDDLLGFYQPGVNAGLRVVAVLGEKWRLGPEILYSQQGAKRNKNSANISEFREIQLNTVELPLMVYYKDWRLTAEAGTSYQRVIDYGVTNFRGEDVTTVYPFATDLLALKFGVTIYLTPNVGFNFRWSKHLTDLQVAEEPRLRGRTMALRAVYTIGAGETLPRPTEAR